VHKQDLIKNAGIDLLGVINENRCNHTHKIRGRAVAESRVYGHGDVPFPERFRIFLTKLLSEQHFCDNMQHINVVILL